MLCMHAVETADCITLGLLLDGHKQISIETTERKFNLPSGWRLGGGGARVIVDLIPAGRFLIFNGIPNTVQLLTVVTLSSH